MMTMLLWRRDELGWRPRAAQAKPNPLRWSGAARPRYEAAAAPQSHQPDPAMALAPLPGPPLAHAAGGDAFQFAVDGRNASRRLRTSLEIFTAADRCRQVNMLVLSPASHHLVLHGIAHPLQGPAIQFLPLCELLLYSVLAFQERGKMKWNRSRCRQEIAQHLVKLQRRFFLRFSRAQACFRIGDLAPVHLHS